MLHDAIGIVNGKGDDYDDANDCRDDNEMMRLNPPLFDFSFKSVVFWE